MNDPDTIYVINPNSSEAVTRAIARALAPHARPDGPALRCVTAKAGPPGIESALDAALSEGPMLEVLRRHDPSAAGHVIACFSDPGLAAARRAARAPVIGIQEAACAAALTLGRRFGIIAILADSARRQRLSVARAGLSDRFAASRAVGLRVAELGAGAACFEKLRETGEALRDRDGADVLILGCAGMAAHRAPLQAALGIPVVEPCQAAVLHLRAQLDMGLCRAPAPRAGIAAQ